MICSQRISLSQTAYLSIEEYLYDRKTLFSNVNLRAKHHFVLLYPEFIVWFGPLIYLWTMRFESKPSYMYFNRCARQLHNYKHLSNTLSMRHQLLQAHLASGSLFKTDLSVHDHPVPFRNHLYHSQSKIVSVVSASMKLILLSLLKLHSMEY